MTYLTERQAARLAERRARAYPSGKTAADDGKRVRGRAILAAIACLVLLAGCDRDGQRLTSETVPLDDGRTVVCVREVGVNTRLDCDWSTAK